MLDEEQTPDASAFVEAAPVPRSVVVLASTAFVVAATALQLLRQDGTPMWRTVWAEDATPFLQIALERSWGDVVLEGYAAGYGLALPRTFAWIGARFPVEWYSVVVTLLATTTVSLLALFVFFASARLLGSTLRRAVLAGAMVVLPCLALELVGSIVNLHWYLPIAALFTVLFPVETRGQIVVYALVALAATLSSPLCLLFAPLAGWRLVRAVLGRAAARTAIVPALYLLGAAWQLVTMQTTAGPDAGVAPPLGELVTDVGRLYATRVLTGTVFGIRAAESAWDVAGYWTALVALGVVVAIAVVRYRHATRLSQLVAGAFLVTSAVLYAFSMAQRPNHIAPLLTSHDGPLNLAAARYEVVPIFLLLIGLLIHPRLEWDAVREGRDLPPTSLRAELGAHPWAAGVVAVWLVVAVLPSYRLTNPRSAGPDWVDAVTEAEARCEDGAETVTVAHAPAPTWHATISCEHLVDD